MFNYKTVAIFLFLFSFLSYKCFSQTGKIEGTVKDTLTKEVLIDANVIVEGTSVGALTDVDGKFVIDIAPGKYNLSISTLGFETLILKDIIVKPGQVTYINSHLSTSKEHVEVVVVGTKITNTDAAVVEEVRKAVTIASGISGDQIKRGQDRDAAEAVKRVAGVTVVDNRFVMVRGLSERYNAVMLNNALTPSFEQDVKAFSFDIIPSQMIDRVLVYKAPAPELSGEFAGGAIKIFTSGIPSKNSFNIGLSSSYRQNTTFKDFYHPVRGNSDWLSYSDKTNAYPTGVPDDFSSVYKYDKIKVGQLFRNDTWVPDNNKAPLDLRFNLNFARKISLSGNRNIGIVSAINYSNTHTYFKGIRQQVLPYSDASFIYNSPFYNYKEDLYTQNTRLGLLQNFAFSIGTRHKFEFKNLYNHQGTGQYQLLSGNDERIATGDYYKQHSIFNTYRGLYSGQLSATHSFTANTQFDWTVGYSKANRDEPDIKRYLQVSVDPFSIPYRFNTPGGANALYFGRLYTKTNEDVKMSSGNLEHTFNFAGLSNFKPQLKAGWYLEEKKRQYQLKLFAYDPHVASSGSTYYNDAKTDSLTIQDLNNPQTWNNYNGFVITSGYTGAVSYTASNSLIAYYAGINLPYKGKFNVYSGVRVENNTQTVSKSNHVVSILPSVNATYNFNKKLQLRGAYGKTVNRPEFREVANIVFYDFFFLRAVQGNPNLKVPTIHNSELRLEFYPRFGEVFSIGVFNKNFINPIERISEIGTGGQGNITFQNASRATSFGIEAEIKKELDGLAVVGGRDLLKNISFNFNAALIKSKVHFDSANFLTVKNRPMMGQSPYVINAGLTYNNEPTKLLVNLSYNVIGKRIFIADNNGGNVYEMPRNVFDISITKHITKYIEIKAGIQDILNQRVQFIEDANKDGKVKRQHSNFIPLGGYKGGDVEFIGVNRGSYYTLGVVIKL